MKRRFFYLSGWFFISLLLAVPQTWAGVVRGSVLRGFAIPMVNETVLIYDSGGNQLDGVQTDVNGNYTVNLAAGTYYLRTAVSGNYIDEWYDNILAGSGTPQSAGATQVFVPASGDVTGITFFLTEGGGLQGRVARTNGVGIASNTVELYINDTFFRSTLTDANGDYEFLGLLSGDYYIRTLSDEMFVDEWYDDAELILFGDPVDDGATAVSVTQGVIRTGFDFFLASGGVIKGEVLNPGGAAANGVGVLLYDSNGDFISGLNTDASGEYELGGIPPGTYYLRTSSGNPLHINKWFNDVDVQFGDVTDDGANSMVVAVGVTNTANFQLGRRQCGLAAWRKRLLVRRLTA